MRMATMALKNTYRKYVGQASQDGVQPRIRLYELHQHITVNVDKNSQTYEQKCKCNNNTAK